MHGYPGAWHVDFSIFSQNDDGRKEECNICLFLDEEVYDPLYYSERSVADQAFPCSISLKELSLHDISQGSLSETDLLSSVC